MLAAVRDRFRHFLHFEFSWPTARRLLAYYYKENEIYRIPLGPLRGMKLEYDSQLNVHEMLGLAERRNLFLLKKIFFNAGLLKEKMTFADVGSNIGLYSLWCSRVLGKRAETQAFAFEPSPTVAEKLRRHVTINGVKNITVVETAVGDKVGQAEFFLSANHHTSSLVTAHAAGNTLLQEKSVSVSVTTLDDFFLRGESKAPPDFIKMDIEGGAAQALKGCKEVIKRNRPVMLVDSHNIHEDKAIADVLKENDYVSYRMNDLKWIRNVDGVFGDPDGVWGNQFLFPSEHRAKVAAVIPVRK